MSLAILPVKVDVFCRMDPFSHQYSQSVDCPCELVAVFSACRAESSAKAVQKDAAAIVEDLTATDNDMKASRIKQVSAIAAFNPSNARRDYNKFVRALAYGLELYTCSVLLLEPLSKTTGFHDVPMFLPHELFGSVFSLGWSVFAGVVFGAVNLAEGML